MSSPSANLWVLLGLGLAGVLLVTRSLRRVVKKDLGAFLDRLELLPPPPPPPPKAPHPLSGLSFAVADLFDISEAIASFGCPDWTATHHPATHTSPVISTLVENGATCVGKTVIDDMAFGISGDNKSFGMPTNPVALDRIPGGSSSGSAVAVAAGFVDFALGVDTVGGVRMPGAYCGVLGFRPSHSAVSNIGVIPVSPSLDTVGWFAKEPGVLHKVGYVLLQLSYTNSYQPRQFIMAEDCFDMVKIQSSRLTQVVVRSVERLFGRQVLSNLNLGNYLAAKLSSLKELQSENKNANAKNSTLLSLGSAMHELQKLEFKDQHIMWIEAVKPTIDSYITRSILEENFKSDLYQSIRHELREALNSLLKDDKVLVIPTVLGLPPKLNSKEISSDDYSLRNLSLSAIASMSGCCQVTIPLGTYEKCPVSVSFIARHGGDRFLLDITQSLYTTLQEEIEPVIKSKTSSRQVNNDEAAEAAKEKGNIAYREKQWQKAASLYSEAIKLNGKKAAYYSNRAAAYLELGSYRQAETDCSNAINLEPKNVKAYLRRGTAREMLGYYKGAIDDFQYALVLEPTNKTANLAVNRLKKIFQ
ncbi:Glutamyl-tRNA(Gln) amidotransferase subunit A [Rhynchospora pubera]|uniref:Glutamyl-tRNA(Gln) amidotransferase subunit A n=1 Tax=Rhynchospora pubera TaxID=906938 RepID=A0AAV8CIF5_9POAL|nr:Glutamyl-tRNA(Gln) amidotransferase subunit A [Rhynchospora pubera]KAJ4815206.1 Glutamyl-tRNA(Gln) amidotransferase subunit A [Rhynchospora pubera]